MIFCSDLSYLNIFQLNVNVSDPNSLCRITYTEILEILLNDFNWDQMEFNSDLLKSESHSNNYLVIQTHTRTKSLSLYKDTLLHILSHCKKWEAEHFIFGQKIQKLIHWFALIRTYQWWIKRKGERGKEREHDQMIRNMVLAIKSDMEKHVDVLNNTRSNLSCYRNIHL